MNPRQRRGLLLVVASLLAAICVVVGLSTYTSRVNAQVSDKVQVVRLTTDVAALAPIPASAVTVRLVPKKWLGPSPATTPADLVGRVAAVRLAKGTYLDLDMLRSPPELEAGQRELAILIDAETGVAGKIKSDDYVDILATFKDDTSTNGDEARIIVNRARVLKIGDLTDRQAESASGRISTESVVPVTFALSVADSLIVTYAESFATRVRLALTAPNDTGPLPSQDRVLTGSQLRARVRQ